jgi:phosphatidylglycerophosphate synthase
MLKTDSDLGKFEDVTVDNIMVIIFPLALIWQGLISGFLGAYYIYIVSLSWWLSVIRLNQREKTNWIIKPQASALLHFMRFWIITVLMFMYAFWRVDIFWETILILSIILSAISLYDYYQIIKVRLKSRNQPH